MSIFNLSRKTAVVTGGGSGLGRAIACGLAEHGATVHVWDIDVRAANDTAKEISLSGGSATAEYVDVTDCAAVDKCMRAAAEASGLDILVVSAGIADRAAALDMTTKAWAHVLDVNLTGAWYCNRSAGSIMAHDHRGGSIVNVASVAGIVGVETGNVNYAASKGGLIAMSRTLAVEWAPQSIRVNVLAPSHFRTPLIERTIEANPAILSYFLGNIPLGRLGEPQDIVGPAVLLASDASAMITGHVLIVDGGHTAK